MSLTLIILNKVSCKSSLSADKAPFFLSLLSKSHKFFHKIPSFIFVSEKLYCIAALNSDSAHCVEFAYFFHILKQQYFFKNIPLCGTCHQRKHSAHLVIHRHKNYTLVVNISRLNISPKKIWMAFKKMYFWHTVRSLFICPRAFLRDCCCW